MRIRSYRSGDVEQIARLIKSTFLRYNESEGSREAVREYVGRYSTDRLEQLADLLQHDTIIFVADDSERVVGVVRGNEHRVFQLFVDERYHGQGLGRKPMERFENTARRKDSRQINLRSSLYAIQFYEHLGYRKTTGIRTSLMFGDIRYQPMKKELK